MGPGTRGKDGQAKSSSIRNIPQNRKGAKDQLPVLTKEARKHEAQTGSQAEQGRHQEQRCHPCLGITSHRMCGCRPAPECSQSQGRKW